MEKVRGKPSSYSFLKMVEILDRRNEGQCPSVSSRPKAESIVFRANPTFGFPAADIHALEYAESGPCELTVNFLGLYGPSSPLPDYFTQSIIDEMLKVESEDQQVYCLRSESELRKLIEGRIDFSSLKKITERRQTKRSNENDNKVSISSIQFAQLKVGLSYEEVLDTEQLKKLSDKNAVILLLKKPAANQRDFLDVFNHRLISLYLEALCKYHSYRKQLVEKDYFVEHLFSLIGAPNRSQRAKSAINWIRLLRFSGLIIVNKGNSEVLCKVVAGYFNFATEDVTIDQHVYRRSKIEPTQQNCLGTRNCRVAHTFSIGANVCDRTQMFRLNIYNLSEELFKSLLPENPFNSEPHLLNSLREIIEFLKPDNLSVEIALHLKLPSQLALNTDKKSQCVLGYTSWLHSPPTKSRHVVI